MRPHAVQLVLRRCALAMACGLAGLAGTHLAPAAVAPHPVVVGFERFYSTADANLAEGGELLLGELGCIHCHPADAVVTARLTMHEAPQLEGIKHRVQPGFLPRWLENLQQIKPGTVMPDLLVSSDIAGRKRDARAITQFLLSLEAKPVTAGASAGDVEAGRTLFHTIGCVACHAPEAGFKPPRAAEGAATTELIVPSVPLGELAEKYTPGGLTRFLLDPLRVRPAARMPHFAMSDEEARNVASYLLRNRKSPGAVSDELPKGSPSDVELGRIRFAELGCAACHQVLHAGSPIPSTLKSRPLNELAGASNRGCLAVAPPAGVPVYGLNQHQREALAAALKHIRDGRALAPGQLAQRWMTALNCFACHLRDDRGGPEPGRKVYFETTGADLEDEGRLPPTLTGVGRKLWPPALEAIITGKGAVRPYMATRMPDFGATRAQHFSQWFIATDLTTGIKPTPRQTDQTKVGRNMWGRALMGATGLSCISCHNLRSQKSLGIGAIDLANAPKRLRAEWFRDYLMDPAKFRPGTRMPAFWPDGKPLTKANGGTTERQIDSIWVYLNEIDQSRLPEGMEEKDNFELKPKDRPIVFRTFMEVAGMHAIAVGFPQGLHAAFDAKTVCWSLFWKGRFLDAESTWDDRFTPLAKPLGEAVFKLPGVFQLVVPTADGAPASGSLANVAFGGYRLDKQGVPTFLYRFHGLQVEDRITPDASGKAFVQTIHLKGAARPVLYRLPAKQNKPEAMLERVTILEPKRMKFQVVAAGTGQELQLPVNFDAQNEATLVLRWNW